MKKNIQIILEELYESFPSLKQQEEKIIPFIEVFLKTNIQITPDVEFKNRLKKELLQKISLSSSKNQNNFWQNFKIISSVFATGLAVYGVFSFYHLQIRPLSDNTVLPQVQEESFKSDASSLESQDLDIPSIKDTSWGDFKKRETSKINTLQSTPSSWDTKQVWFLSSLREVPQKSIIAPPNIPSNANTTDTPSQNQDANVSVPTFPPNSDNQITPSNWLLPLIRVGSSWGNSSSDSSWFPSLQENQNWEEWGDSQMLFKSLPMANLMMSDMLSEEPMGTNVWWNQPIDQVVFKIVWNWWERKNADTIFQSKKISPSFSEYAVSVDSLDNALYIKSNRERKNSATVIVNAEDIPSPDQLTQKFSSLLQKTWLKGENLKLDSFELSKKLSQVFDENVTFNIPYTILWKEVYDTDGQKITLEVVYNFSLRDFEFVWPIYDFSPLSSDISSSPLLLSNTNEFVEFENMVLLKQEEKVFVKVFYNGKYIFVPGGIYRVTQKPASVLWEKYIYPDFWTESIPKQIR